MEGHTQGITALKKPIQAITPRLQSVGMLSLLFANKAFKRVAYDNGMQRSELEILSAIKELGIVNEKRIGLAWACVPEIQQTCATADDRRTCLALRTLTANGFIVCHGSCNLWKRNPMGYSITHSGLKVLAQIPEKLKEYQIMLDKGYKGNKY